jgi:peptidyl-prolyl cis-trans isomerase C
MQSPKDSILSLEEQNQLLEKAIETADHILKVLDKYNLDENKGENMSTAVASHILVSSLEEAENLKNQLTEGASFSDLASQHSLCPSRAAGGNLGLFVPGMMVPRFEEVAFATPIGEISEPVKTQFGYHIIHRTG